MPSAASIHTTSSLLTDCVLDLAAHADTQDTLHEGVKTIPDVEGRWDGKDMINEDGKVDSFIKESQRLAGNPSVHMYVCENKLIPRDQC